jgi:hypothetical protein
MPGTHDDAVLMIEIAKWGSMMGLADATRTIFAEDFDPDAAKASDPSVQAVLNFYETIGTLVKNDLLDRALVLDWLWAAGAWSRVGPAAKRARDGANLPRLYENFEALAG